jgi:hypothetical protein
MTLKLLVATPTIDHSVSVGYMNSIIGFNSLLPEIETSVITLGGNSVITDARNRLFTFFVNSDHDALLFLDSDVAISPQDIVIIEKDGLRSGKHIIGLPVMKKNYTQPVLNIGQSLSDIDSHGYMEVDGISTSALVISKWIATEIVKQVSTYSDSPNDTINTGNSKSPELIYDVFKVYNDTGKYWHEDYGFCNFVRKELNEKIYAKMNCVTQHFSGSVPFVYNGV